MGSITMAVPRLVLHIILLVESVFLYYAVLRVRNVGRLCGSHSNTPHTKPPPTGRSRLNTIYVVTPTYTRPTQLADLTRLANTLRLVPDIHWLVSEDRNTTSDSVAELLAATGLSYTQLAAVRPAELVGKVIGRGVFNRRAALDWIREYGQESGVIYFADDDNSYDVRIFEEIRQTVGVSVFPVGLILKYGVSSPIVQNGKVTGFFDAFQAGRRFAMDMAGFSVSVKHFKSKPDATFPAKVSFLEEGFMRSLEVAREDLEPRAQQCTKVWVWHTRTEKAATPKMEHIVGWEDSNLPQLYAGLYAK